MMKKSWKAVLAVLLSAGMVFTPVLADEAIFEEETVTVSANDEAAFAADDQTAGSSCQR